MRLKRIIHLQTSIVWLPLGEVAPDVQMGTDAELFGLVFADPDGETHIFVLDADGKEGLMRQLTGGIVLPR